MVTEVVSYSHVVLINETDSRFFYSFELLHGHYFHLPILYHPSFLVSQFLLPVSLRNVKHADFVHCIFSNWLKLLLPNHQEIFLVISCGLSQWFITTAIEKLFFKKQQIHFLCIPHPIYYQINFPEEQYQHPLLKPEMFPHCL